MPDRAAAGWSVLLTGAAGGIGSALARRLGRAGARIALLDLEPERLEPLAHELAAQGIESVALACDVTSPEACRAATRDAVERWGGVDLLVASAGITHVSLLRDTRVDVLRRVMEVNFFGAVNATQAALPFLLERRGHIVVLSSVAGFAPLASRSGYAASKHALHGLFGSLRAELAGSGVGVTLVCPSFVNTAIGDRALGGDGGKPVLERTQTGTPVEPDVLAERIYRAALERRPLLVPFRDARLAWWLARLAPDLYERVMRRRILRDAPTVAP